MYGKTFPSELVAAGLANLPFAWMADGSFLFDESLTVEQRAAIQAVAAAHNPDAVPSIQDQIDSLELERLAIVEKINALKAKL